MSEIVDNNDELDDNAVDNVLDSDGVDTENQADVDGEDNNFQHEKHSDYKVSDGKGAVMSLDMCGAIAMKRHFPTAIIYVAKDKEDMIADIVQSDFPVGEKTLRLLSLDAEKRNREICDFVIDNRDEQGSERILQLLNF